MLSYFTISESQTNTHTHLTATQMAHSYLLLLLFLLVFLASTSSSRSMAQATDQETLLTIKKDWGSPSALSSWNPQNASSYCSWVGVSCNKNGQVTKLSFPNLNIYLSVPFHAALRCACAVSCRAAHLANCSQQWRRTSGPTPLAAAAAPTRPPPPSSASV
ncbi:hypothetical protein PVAP13_1NG193819 [Panicum virgatum]|uniref:Leucine-rich repeat-containing N-terminal plant-type domain-containing protein n=1 Tax=Panicum virgatum TaxID=38727 RepID=A0A8T0WRN8_PANVG|nr:hypothetical protein PVAP13_1NG193819 [Panicum virgatum]